jgi:hypothetical protein
MFSPGASLDQVYHVLAYNLALKATYRTGCVMRYAFQAYLIVDDLHHLFFPPGAEIENYGWPSQS